ncbi:MAG: V-type ATP synthase subunit A [Spirochaetia bacterium]
MSKLASNKKGVLKMERLIGKVQRVTGPVVHATGISDAAMMELVYTGEHRLVGEIVKLRHNTAVIQVYENTAGVAPGDNIYGSGNPLSLQLGPGLIGSIYDGIQRPLNKLEEISGHFIGRGIQTDAIDQNKQWGFKPRVKNGQDVKGGDILGVIDETPHIEHRIMVPYKGEGKVTFVVQEGNFTVKDVIVTIRTTEGEIDITMQQKWPIRTPRPIQQRLQPSIPLITGQRIIDALFPLAKGGTVALPGPFGAGKTMTQHAIAKWCDADLIIYVGCGERGNEMTDVLNEFPNLIDPHTGRSLMERTILVANTSNMPVSAREASVYTGMTLAEYYRDMGYHVAVMADSTSRWAEAMRELSGRMEEMPAEEGFPAYLPTRIAGFYERAGLTKNLNDTTGSVSVIGAVSPPGGDFSEPVTQHTKRFVRAFWALDRQLAYARHFPALSWLDSYSEYRKELEPWWEAKVGKSWQENIATISELLQKEQKLQQIVKLVGPDALPEAQRFILEVCTLFKNGFLQQNAFDKVDAFSTPEKQDKMLSLIILYWKRGSQALDNNVPLIQLKRLECVQKITRMRFYIENENLSELEMLASELERNIAKLEARNA